MSESPRTGPYAEAASKYRVAGWLGVLPVGYKPAEKGPPPKGRTGHEGTDPTDDQVVDWVAKRGDRNVALRLPKNVVGIDVDAYDGKTGAETLDVLESELGSLPKTWVSTARVDGISGIRFFRVPEQFRPSRDLTGGIELVWHGHRYAVVAPSVHPATGDNYCWITPHGEKQAAVDPPKSEDLAELPDSWQAFLAGEVDTERSPAVSGPEHYKPVTVESKLAEVLADLAAAAETGGRHDAATRGAMALANLVVAEWPGAEEAMTELGEAFITAISPDRPREAPDEWRRMRDGGLAKVLAAETNVPTWKDKQQSDADSGRGIDFSGCYIPDGFWDARPEFAHVRDAAHSRGRSADAVLATVLARLAADTDHTIQLPPTIGSATNLSLIVAPVGPPASGKSTAIATASDLMAPKVLKPECDRVPPGSGEGLLELLFDFVPDPNDPNGKKTIHTQVRHNAFVVFDEGEIATVLATRSGSVLLPTLRTIFTSGVLGQANATQERKRIIPPGQAAFGVVVGIQPDLVGALFAGAGAGTPQRFLWAATTAPTPKPGSRPDWPGPLPRQNISSPVTSKHQQSPGGYNRLVLTIPKSVKREVEDNDHHRQQHGALALDEHTDLIRLKVAGLLAVWQGRLSISEEDWELAGVVVGSSRKVRDRLRNHLQAKQREQEKLDAEKVARRSVVVTEKTENWRVVQVAGKLAAKVHKEPGKWAPGKLRASLSTVQREWFDDALEHATDSGWVVLRTDDTEGSTRERLFPGESKPS